MRVGADVAHLLLVVLLTGACGSPFLSSTSRDPGPGPIRRVLLNGTVAVVQEHHGTDIAAIQLWVRAGGRDETAAELGLAHYLEHMLFKGTATRPAGLAEREVEALGGRINAATSWDYTYYHLLLPSRRVMAGIELLADLGVNASLDPASLDQEKQVVLEEMRATRDNPRRLLARSLYETVFAGHPYGRPVIGTADLITALDRETLVRFYRRHYLPEAFTLVVVGPVDTRQVLAAAETIFGRLPRGGARRLPAAAAPMVRNARLELPTPGTAAHLGLAWSAPSVEHAHTPALDLLVSVLGQRRSSRLFQGLRQRLGLVTGISASFAALEAGGVVSVVAQLAPDQLARAEQEILREIDRLRAEGITETERRRAVTAEEAQRSFMMETPEGRALALGRAETVWRIEDELAYLDRLRAVTNDQIRSAARRYLDPERYVRIALIPESRRGSSSDATGAPRESPLGLERAGGRQ